MIIIYNVPNKIVAPQALASSTAALNSPIIMYTDDLLYDYFNFHHYYVYY